MDDLMDEIVFDRFDICEAYYAYAVEHHQGQWSPEYSYFGRLLRMGFKPSPALKEKGFIALSVNGGKIFDQLIRRTYD